MGRPQNSFEPHPDPYRQAKKAGAQAMYQNQNQASLYDGASCQIHKQTTIFRNWIVGKMDAHLSF